jgi:hypothetical protein
MLLLFAFVCAFGFAPDMLGKWIVWVGADFIDVVGTGGSGRVSGCDKGAVNGPD